MKTSYITMAILATTFIAQTASAKMGQNRTNTALNSNVEINVIEEINNNINNILAKVEKPAVKAEVAKQLSMNTIQLQTNKLVQTTEDTLPTFKFKVVIAD